MNPTEAPTPTAYWAAQVQAVLDRMGNPATVEQGEGEVLITLDGETDREDRGDVIWSLVRRGFTVASETRDEQIRIDAEADPLNHPFDETAVYPTEGNL